MSAKRRIKLSEIINSVIEYSALEAGNIELYNAPFDLRKVVNKAVLISRPLAADKELQILWEIDPRVPQSLLGDGPRIRQILLALLDNGVKFTEKGEVSVRVTLEKPVEKVVHLRIDVSDTGIGIPRQDQSRISRPSLKETARPRDSWRAGSGTGNL